MSLLKVEVPGSKSMTQRALIISSLARRPLRITGALDCDDSRHLTSILQALGVEVDWVKVQEVSVIPKPFVPPGKTLFCGNGGTAMRFGSCLSLITDFELVMDGDSRMRERPIGPLGKALNTLGVDVRYLINSGFPPMSLRRLRDVGTDIEVDASLSSQFASGLLMVAPCLAGGLVVSFGSKPVSLSYLRMTSRMMERAGAEVRWDNLGNITIKPGEYFPDDMNPTFQIEPDWSSAAFLLAASHISGVEIEIPGMLPPNESLQGDSVFAEFLAEMKNNREHEIDLSDCPDLIAPLVAVSLFASHKTRIKGAAHTRVKESDRIAVLCGEFAKIGARFVEYEDGMDVFPLGEVEGVDCQLDPHGDHRMAMAFGVASLIVPGIKVMDLGCVTKSFPSFWEELKGFRGLMKAK